MRYLVNYLDQKGTNRYYWERGETLSEVYLLAMATPEVATIKNVYQDSNGTQALVGILLDPEIVPERHEDKVGYIVDCNDIGDDPEDEMYEYLLEFDNGERLWIMGCDLILL